MFGEIAGRYDLLNRLLTFGRDRYWRRELVKLLEPRPGELALDLACGTGDLAATLVRAQPDCLARVHIFYRSTPHPRQIVIIASHPL